MPSGISSGTTKSSLQASYSGSSYFGLVLSRFGLTSFFGLHFLPRCLSVITYMPFSFYSLSFFNVRFGYLSTKPSSFTLIYIAKAIGSRSCSVICFLSYFSCFASYFSLAIFLSCSFCCGISVCSFCGCSGISGAFSDFCVSTSLRFGI